MRVNTDAKWIDKNGTTLNMSTHDCEWNQGCETIRDRITINPKSNG